MDISKKVLARRYLLQKLVGSGGMADVYQAIDQQTEALLAIKVLRPELAKGKARKLFEREAEVLRKMGHPSIVRFYDYGVDGPYFFIAMDWINGPNLKQELERLKGNVSLSFVGKCLADISSALHYAHGKRLFHCDIKPSNILINTGNNFVLADFGIARIRGDRFEGGTALYMAPEQFVNGAISARTDVYSLGITLFEMLSRGRGTPFNGAKAPQTANSRRRIQWEHFNMSVPSISAINPAVPNKVDKILEKALCKNPKQRFSSVKEFQSALQQAFKVRQFERTSLRDRYVSGSNGTSTIPGSLRKSAPAKPYMRIQTGQWGGMFAQVTSSGLFLGRQKANNLRFDDKSVSRRHAVIWVQGKKVYLKDLESTLGTMVNGKRIEGIILLRDGDLIQIGRADTLIFKQ